MPRRARSAEVTSRKKSITTSSGARSASATTADRPSKSVRKAKQYLSSLTPEAREAALLGLVRPLLEFFAEIDDVFSEDDALDASKRQMGMGRTYRSWKKCRAAMDPDYDPEVDQRGDPTTAPGVRLANGSVLQPRRRRAQRSWSA